MGLGGDREREGRPLGDAPAWAVLWLTTGSPAITPHIPLPFLKLFLTFYFV